MMVYIAKVKRHLPVSSAPHRATTDVRGTAFVLRDGAMAHCAWMTPPARAGLMDLTVWTSRAILSPHINLYLTTSEQAAGQALR